MKYPSTVHYENNIYHGMIVGNEVHYVQIHGLTRILGFIDLPDGWQDMDRTWTAQDISWITLFDCMPLQGEALPKKDNDFELEHKEIQEMTIIPKSIMQTRYTI